MDSIKIAYNQFLNTQEGGEVYNEFKDVLYTPSDSLAQMINKEVIRHLVCHKEGKIKICDIGGGDGKRMIHILSFLAQKCPHLRFELDFVEQSKFFCSEFEKRKSEITNADVTIHHSLFENVVDKLLPKSYDIVFLIHSIFAFQDENIVKKILSLIKHDGKITFISNAENSLLAQLKQILDQRYMDSRTEIGDIKKILRRLGISYSSDTFYTNFCISRADINGAFHSILNWLSLGKYSGASIQEFKAAKEKLLSLGKEEGDNYCFTEQEEILLIPPMSGLLFEKHISAAPQV